MARKGGRASADRQAPREPSTRSPLTPCGSPPSTSTTSTSGSANLLAWLAEDRARRRLPAGAEGRRRPTSPRPRSRPAGYGAVWRGQRAWNGVAILARGADPVLTRDALPGDPDDREARYVEAAVGGVLVGCLYAPNGNPQPGPKFDYKLAWMAPPRRPRRRAARHRPAGGARRRLQRRPRAARPLPDPRPTTTTRWSSRRRAPPMPACWPRAGPTRCAPSTRTSRGSTPSGTTAGTAGSATAACASTTCCSAPPLAPRLRRRRRRPRGARRGERQRPRPGLDRARPRVTLLHALDDRRRRQRLHRGVARLGARRSPAVHSPIAVGPSTIRPSTERSSSRISPSRRLGRGTRWRR